MNGRPWTKLDLATLDGLYPLNPLAEIARTLRRPVASIRTKARRLHHRREREGNQKWTERDNAELLRLYPHMRTDEIAKRMGRPLRKVYAKATALGLCKSAEYLATPDACRLRRGDNVGLSSRFMKGHATWNKGVRMPGWAPGRMAETQFKVGQRTNTWQPIGTLSLSDGFLRMKVRDDKQSVAGVGGSSTNWMFVHKMVWEIEHGPVPAGHVVAFKDGDKLNVALENLELLSRRELMLRNSVHHLPKALVEVIQLTGALKRQIRRRENGQEQNRRSAGPSVRDLGNAQG